MRTPRGVLVAGMVAAALAPSAASADPCVSGRARADAPPLAEPWGSALASLLSELSMAGQPWSCAGGVVDLKVVEGGATLTVVYADGRSVSREVSSPDDVVPLGEALLTRPLPPAPPTETPPEPAAKSARPAAKKSQRAAPGEASEGGVAAEEAAPPRALVSLLVAPRYAGKTNAVLGGAAAHADIPFGAWRAGAWVRYDALSAPIGGPGGSLSELCIGVSAGRSLSLSRFELSASATASAAIVTTLGDKGGDMSQVSGRFGAEARGAFVLTKLLRAVVALDAELAPSELGSHGPPRGSSEEPPGPGGGGPRELPSYMIGLGVGVELALR